MGAAGGIVQLGPYRLQRKWDSAPKIRFELDSPPEGAVTSEPVSENSIPEAFWAVISRFWHRKWHKIARLACGRRDRLTATKPLRTRDCFRPGVDRRRRNFPSIKRAGRSSHACSRSETTI